MEENTPERTVAPARDQGTEPVENDTASASPPNTANVAEPAVTVTFFNPGEKSKGRTKATTWPKLFSALAAMKPTGTIIKEKLGGWAPATFRDDHRKKENVLAVYAAVFDFDNAIHVDEKQTDGTIKKVKKKLPEEQIVTLDGAMAAFPDVMRFAYTSWSHSPEWPHLRLVVPYTRAVTGKEQERIWEQLARRFTDAGMMIDTQCKDASRLWFLPARRDNAFETRLEPGALFDADAVLAAGEAASANMNMGDDTTAAVSDPYAVSDVDIDTALDLNEVSTSERLKRGSKYLAKIPGAVSGSGGHVATLKAANALVRGFALSPEFALALLRDEYNPRCQPPWSDKELRHKIDSASKDSTTTLGALLQKRSKPMKAVPDATGPTTDADGIDSGAQGAFACTDLGNAERLFHHHGQDLRYCAPWEKWLVWTGTRWQIANKKQVERLAQVTVRSIYKEAAAETDPDRRKVLAEHAKRSESNARKVALIEQAKSLPGIPILPDELDSHPWLLNVQNGTIDLTTGVLSQHCRKDLLTKLAGTSYDPNATSPLYDIFLARVLPDQQVRGLVNRLDGYALTGVVQDHVFPIHYGKGRNGKGVHTNTVLHVMGDYARQIPTELLLAKRGDSHPTEKTTLFGTRLAVAVETEENRALNVAFIKQATGGDRISARRMREDFWEFDPTHKIQLSTNHRPVIRETKDAIWERVLLIPWTVKIPETERDPKLGEKLKAEAPGILAKLVRACLDWQQGGLAIPQAVRAATEQFRSEMDVLGKFIADCCIVDEHVEDASTRLFTAFVEWAKANNERELSQTAFGTQLGERGFNSARDSKTGRSVWRGLRFRDDVAVGQGATSSEGHAAGISNEELERQFDEASNGLPEGSEGSEPDLGLVPHEGGILALSRNALQTLQTLQAVSPVEGSSPQISSSMERSSLAASATLIGTAAVAATLMVTSVGQQNRLPQAPSVPHLLVEPDDDDDDDDDCRRRGRWAAGVLDGFDA